MIINNIQFGAELEDILIELQSQLQANNIILLQKMKSGPDNIQVQCPYHKNGQERRPSAGIKKSDGTFHCLGCGETHTLQEVISHCFGHNDVSGMWGWNWLLKNFLTIAVEERKDVELDFARNSNSTSNMDIQNYVSEKELDSYRYYHPYMYKRGLTDEIIEIFDIGYDKNTDCLTFPNRDINGNTLFVARRSVKTKFFNYPQGVDKPVYGLYEYYQEYKRVEQLVYGGGRCNGKTYAIGKLSEVIICESMLDALTCWVYGKYAVALNGLGTESQFEQLRKMPCRKFIIATDMDNAGQKARKRIRKGLKGKLITEYVWDVNIAKDINDMSKEMFDKLEEVF